MPSETKDCQKGGSKRHLKFTGTKVNEQTDRQTAMAARGSRHQSSNEDRRSWRGSGRGIDSEDSSSRRDSRRLTSDVYVDLVMPHIASLRQQINSKDSSIGSLEQSLAQLEEKNNLLSRDVRNKTKDVALLEERLQIAEEATLSALKEICKERDVAGKEAQEFRSRFQVSQLKLRKEIEKYHRLHLDFESGRTKWAKEKEQLQKVQKNAGVKLLALLEELLDVPPDPDQGTGTHKPNDAASWRKSLETVRNATYAEAVGSTRKSMDADKSVTTTEPATSLHYDAARSEDETSSGKPKVRDRANSSKKRLSTTSYSDSVPDVARESSEVPPVPTNKVPNSDKATSKDTAESKRIDENETRRNDTSSYTTEDQGDGAKLEKVETNESIPSQKSSKAASSKATSSPRGQVSTKQSKASMRSLESSRQSFTAAQKIPVPPIPTTIPADAVAPTKHKAKKSIASRTSIPRPQTASARPQNSTASGKPSNKAMSTKSEPPKTPTSRANSLPAGMRVPPRLSSRQAITAQGSPVSKSSTRMGPTRLLDSQSVATIPTIREKPYAVGAPPPEKHNHVPMTRRWGIRRIWFALRRGVRRVIGPREVVVA